MLLCLGQSCSTAPKTPENPPAAGFDLEHSDAQAMRIADSVMMAMGGRGAWDSTNVIQWNFFGSRTLTWDKKAGKVRIEIPSDSVMMALDLNTRAGVVTQKGVALTQPDSLKAMLESAYQIWVNDSYWLVMPFKLKDSGVTLTYVKADTALGKSADQLQLTFKGVGVTPDNKYYVWVDRDSRLVSKWAYFPKATDPEPRFTGVWTNYSRHGKILLSSGRGPRGMENIAVMDQAPEGFFEGK
ncbi:MAG: hypothetical protein EAZ89_05520 [Bacteroidetes bacterium]|nr:MAG: hypothetical protein EAZ89_05520 [Bacteroidota bacterium]